MGDNCQKESSFLSTTFTKQDLVRIQPHLVRLGFIISVYSCPISILLKLNIFSVISNLID